MGRRSKEFWASILILCGVAVVVRARFRIATPAPVPHLTKTPEISSAPTPSNRSDKDKVTIFDINPGLTRREVQRMLGSPSLSEEKYDIFQFPGGEAVNVQYDGKGVAYWVEGSRVEIDGVVHTLKEDPVPETRSIDVTRDADGHPVAFRLTSHFPRMFYQLPAPGSSIYLLDFMDALKTPGAAAKILEAHPDLVNSRLLPQGQTPLYFASKYGDLALVRELLSMGAPADDRIYWGKTSVLDVARTSRIAELLLENGRRWKNSVRAESRRCRVH